MTTAAARTRRRNRLGRTRLTQFELVFMLGVIGGGVVLVLALLFYAAQSGGG